MLPTRAERLGISLRYLVREKLHQLRHPDRPILFGFVSLLILGLWLEIAFILSLRGGAPELAELAAQQGLEARDVIVSIYFLFLQGLTLLLVLFGFARAQTIDLDRIRFLPLESLEIFSLELSSKLLAALGIFLFLLPLMITTMSWLGGGPAAGVLLVIVSLMMAAALAEFVVLVRLVIEGMTQAGRVIFRVAFAVFVLGGYSLRFLLSREQGMAVAAAKWSPWGVPRRVVLESDAAASLALIASVVLLFVLGLLAYRAIYLGDFRVTPSISGIDGAAPFRWLGSPLALAGRETHTIFRLDCTQVFRNPLAFTIFISPAVILLVLNSGTGVLENPAWRFRIPLVVSYLLTSLVGLNPIGRDGVGYLLLRMMPVQRRSELNAKLGLPVVISFAFGGAVCVYYFWGAWTALVLHLVVLFIFWRISERISSFIAILLIRINRQCQCSLDLPAKKRTS